MAEPFIGEIRIFSFDYAPKGWAFCNGQLLSISQSPELYVLLGTFYGGNGIDNFGLPDLRSRIPVHTNNPETRGAKFGVEKVKLTTAHIPTHRHALYAIDKKGESSDPSGRALCKPVYKDEPKKMYNSSLFNLQSINPASITDVGGEAHNNIQPSLVLNFCIALQGLYPPRI